MEPGMNRSAQATKVGLLHTVSTLVAPFQSAVASAAPGVDIVHVVDPTLLADAIRDGVTPDVTRRVEGHIEDLVEGGADAVLVTCSSIGEAVEAAAAKSGVPVLRVDAPMAAQAVAIAQAAGAAADRRGSIRVLATLEATLGPTGRLIERAAEGADVDVDARIVTGALEAREAGDQPTHDRLIRQAVVNADRADVIVLAQASMAGAITEIQTHVPVLTSPEGGVRALAQSLVQRPRN